MINIGDLLDNRYRVLELIGSGGMAEVFVANDIISKSFVAIKIMKDSLTNDPENFANFKSEIEMTASMSHPNIVKVFNAGLYKDCPYLITEYFKDQTLSERLDYLTKFQLNEAIEIMIQLLSALEYTHNHKLIHRDIKPQNIFYFSNGLIKLGDYGIAFKENASCSNKILGSIHYLAPEIYKGVPYSVRSDIYAAGVTLFQLITGRLPFEERTYEEIKSHHLNRKFPNASSIVVNLPKEIDDIISKATCKNPSSRYLNVCQFKNDLISLKNGTYKKENFLRKILRKI